MLGKALIFALFVCVIVGDENADNSLKPREPSEPSDLSSATNTELLTKLLNSTKTALKIYDRKLDSSIPWNYLSNAINVMGLDLQDYSSDAVYHLINAGQSIRVGLDKSFQERRKVFGWAVFTKSVLESYVHVINVTNFTDTTVIFETIDRSTGLFTNVITGFDGVLNHYLNAVSELESLKEQLKADKTDGSSFFSNQLKTIRIKINYNSPEIATFGGVLEFLQKIQFCRCNDLLNDAFGGLGLVDEVQFKTEMLSKRLNIIETMYDDVKNEFNGIIATIRDFRQKLETEINLMREYKSQMEKNDVNFKNFPIDKDVDVPIIKNLIVDCDDYIQSQSSDDNKLH